MDKAKGGQRQGQEVGMAGVGGVVGGEMKTTVSEQQKEREKNKIKYLGNFKKKSFRMKLSVIHQM